MILRTAVARAPSPLVGGSRAALLLLLILALLSPVTADGTATATPSPTSNNDTTAAPTTAPGGGGSNGTSAPTVSLPPTSTNGSNSTFSPAPSSVPTVVPTSPGGHNDTTVAPTPAHTPQPNHTLTPTPAPHTPKPYHPPEDPTPAPSPDSSGGGGGTGGRTLWQKFIHAVGWTIAVLISAFAFAVCVSERRRIWIALTDLCYNLRTFGVRPYIEGFVRWVRSIPCPRINLRGWSFSSLRRQQHAGMDAGGAYMSLGGDDFDDPNEGLLMGSHEE